MGGLSSPVLCWFNAYYAPGHLTVGLDAHVSRLEAAKTRMDASLKQYGAARHKPVVIAISFWSDSTNAMVCGAYVHYIQSLDRFIMWSDSAMRVRGRLQVWCFRDEQWALSNRQPNETGHDIIVPIIAELLCN